MPPQRSAGVLRSPSTPPPRFSAAPHLEPEPSNLRLRPQSSETRHRHTEANGRRSWWKGLLAATYTTQSPLCKSSLLTAKKSSNSGTGSERASDRSNLSFQRVSAIAPPPERSLRVQDRSRGATPSSTPPRFPMPKQPIPKQTHPIPHPAKALCLTPHPHPDTQAAAGQGRNEHRIVATIPPSASAR